jgi:NADH-ubiquinone oxidoreductase chain 6
MNSIFLVKDIYTNGYITNTLDIISLIAIISGILVIISNNPIISILFLIGLFGSISSYLIILGLNFIGLSYLIVYIGAVSILFLFILMLINVRTSELQSNTSNSIPLGIIIIFVVNFILFKILPSNVITLKSNDSLFLKIKDKIELLISITNTENKLLFITSKT